MDDGSQMIPIIRHPEYSPEQKTNPAEYLNSNLLKVVCQPRKSHTSHKLKPSDVIPTLWSSLENININSAIITLLEKLELVRCMKNSREGEFEEQTPPWRTRLLPPWIGWSFSPWIGGRLPNNMFVSPKGPQSSQPAHTHKREHNNRAFLKRRTVTQLFKDQNTYMVIQYVLKNQNTKLLIY